MSKKKDKLGKLGNRMLKAGRRGTKPTLRDDTTATHETRHLSKK